ncbi:MAG TPA: class I SAM-dependent methyltransferase [Acidimicrobiales bacterium]|nr:class I SAM-dependent methyltransferase [Acidimicrobiales bacterium]
MTDSPSTMWEQRFAGETYFYGTEPNEFLRTSLSKLPKGAAMCLAEGEGRNAVFLAESGYQVSSVDLTQTGVDKTMRLAEERGVKVNAVVGDLASFDLGRERWDLVVSIFAHVPPDVRRSLHRRVVDSLKSGGALLLEAYTPDQVGRGTGGPQDSQLTMTLDSLRLEFAQLEFIHAEELDRDVLEGAGHTGHGAVVQVIARKPA